MIHLAILFVIIVGVIAICAIAVKAMGLSIPAWVAQILCVIFIVVVAVFAIKFLAANL